MSILKRSSMVSTFNDDCLRVSNWLLGPFVPVTTYEHEHDEEVLENK